jgi:hypothetical protein
MNTKKLKFLYAAMLCINLIQSQIQATISNENPTTEKSITFSDNVLPTVYIAASLYIGYNYLIRQEYLVQNKFPIAQMWYEELTKKYPAAQFESKQFVQKPKFSIIPDLLAKAVKNCSWSSSYDHIYFTENALQEITYLYKKVIDGYPLDEKEQLALARQEFILLHEAGHIEHSDATDIIITIIGLLAITQGSEYVYDAIVEPVKTKIENQKIYLTEPFFKKSIEVLEIPGIIFSTPGLTFIAGLIGMLRYQELRADKFACTIADDTTLKGAITIFEDEKADKLYDLENKKMTPFIKTNSTVGKAIQNIVGPVEFILSALVQQTFLVVKSIPETRWIYDFTQDPVHQGPSIRAQFIKDELARREHNQQN